MRLKQEKLFFYGEGTVNNRKCQKLFGNFRVGHYSLNDAPQCYRTRKITNRKEYLFRS